MQYMNVNLWTLNIKYWLEIATMDFRTYSLVFQFRLSSYHSSLHINYSCRAERANGRQENLPWAGHFRPSTVWSVQSEMKSGAGAYSLTELIPVTIICAVTVIMKMSTSICSLSGQSLSAFHSSFWAELCWCNDSWFMHRHAPQDKTKED